MIARDKVEKLAFDKGYRADLSGNVSSRHGRTLTLQSSRKGYLNFGVCDYDGKFRRCFVHRLVAFQKFGDAIHGEGVQVRHVDGNQRNNSPLNLILGSASENAFDKPRATRQRVSGNANRRHNHADIISSYRSSGFTETQKRFSLSKSTLAFIVKRSLVANPADRRAS